MPDLNGQWTAHDHRDAVIDFVNRWAPKTELPAGRFVGWLGISSSKFYDWKARYGLASLLDGMSRSIVHFEIHESMTEPQIELLIQRAKEKYPDAKPRIISDNGPQFIAKDFKQFVRICGMTHVRTSPFYPQSNGKLERFHKTIKSECIRPGTPLSLDDARRPLAASDEKSAGDQAK